MSNSVTNKLANLKKRLQRFLLPCEGKRRNDVAEIISCLEDYSSVGIFGGAVRDIAFSGIDKFCSDVDIVVKNLKSDDLEKILYKFSPKKNRFGGYKLSGTRWPVDIWILEDTWALKESYIQGSSFETLTHTTFFNWDAVVYLPQKKQLVCKKGYLNELKTGVLDINLEENPNPYGMIIRTLRFIENRNAQISYKLAKYLHRYLSEMSPDLICKLERTRFLIPYLEPTRVQFIQTSLDEVFASRQSFDTLSLPSPQLELPFINEQKTTQYFYTLTTAQLAA